MTIPDKSTAALETITQLRSALARCIPAEKAARARDEDGLIEAGGVGSMEMVRFVGEIEAAFGLSFDADDLTAEAFHSLASIARLVELKSASKPSQGEAA